MTSSQSITDLIKNLVAQFVNALYGLSPAGQKILAIALTIGLAVGYGSSAILCSNQKQGYQAQITELSDSLQNVVSERDQLQEINDELEEALQELEDEITDIESYLEGCQEESQDLQLEVSTLGLQIEERDEEIAELTQGLESGDMLGLYIIHADLDEVRDRMNITLGHTLPLNSIISNISLSNHTHRYWDYSEDATGIILGSMSETVEQTFFWSPESADAPEGFLNADDSYYITVTTINEYTEYYYYCRVNMGIDIVDWDFGDDSLIIDVFNEDLECPFPWAAVIGVRKAGTGIYYNVSSPMMVEEGTLGGGFYAWNATASGAPDGFIKKDTKYFIRVTYPAPERWYNWDQDYHETSVWSPPPRDRDDDNGGGEPQEPPEEP